MLNIIHLLLFATVAYASSTVAIPQESTSSLLWETFGFDTPMMMDIAACESADKQEATSSTDDWGYYQINAKTWDTKARELGLDYKNSFHDNVIMAKYILDHAGAISWVCWQKEKARTQEESLASKP